MSIIYDPFTITNLDIAVFIVTFIVLILIIIKMASKYLDSKFVLLVMSLFFLMTYYGFYDTYQNYKTIENVLDNKSYFVFEGKVKQYKRHLHHKVSFQIDNKNFEINDLVSLRNGQKIKIWYFVKNKKKIIFKISIENPD